MSIRNYAEEGKQKVKRNAAEVAQRRASRNFNNGLALRGESAKRGDIETQVTADLLLVTSDKCANGSLTNLIDKKGRAFSCAQALFSANTCLDATYNVKTARRHRKTIYGAFADALPDIIKYGLHVSFLTPTFPNLLGVGFKINDDYQTAVWEMFLQQDVVDEFFYAGYAKTDWTLGGKAERQSSGRAFDLNLDGINYHLHALCINHKAFASGETSYLENKLAHMKRFPKRFTADDKRLIKNSLRIVKAWTRCLRTVYKKMFGKSLRIKTKSGLARFTFQNVSVNEITNYNADESKSGIFFEIAKTASYTAKGMDFNVLTPDLLYDAETTFRNKRMINPFGAFRKAVVRKAENVEPSLVNQPTQQAEIEQLESDNTLFDNVLRGENERIKNYGIRLCSMGLRETWLNYLKVNVPLIIEKRRNDLLGRLPNAIFTDLTGKKYYGWQAERAKIQAEKRLLPEYDAATDRYAKFEAYLSTVFDADEYRQAENEYLDTLTGVALAIA
jgi:hypothetical protein